MSWACSTAIHCSILPFGFLWFFRHSNLRYLALNYRRLYDIPQPPSTYKTNLWRLVFGRFRITFFLAILEFFSGCGKVGGGGSFPRLDWFWTWKLVARLRETGGSGLHSSESKPWHPLPILTILHNLLSFLFILMVISNQIERTTLTNSNHAI